MWHKHADRPGSSYWMTVLHIRSQKFLLIQKISLRLHLSISCLVNFCFLTTHNGTMAINQTQKNENKFIQHENKLIHTTMSSAHRSWQAAGRAASHLCRSPMFTHHQCTEKIWKQKKTLKTPRQIHIQSSNKCRG